MLYFIHGTNTEKTRSKAHGIIDTLQKKKPDALFFKVDAEELTKDMLDELIGGQGLFEKKYIVFLNTVCANAEGRDALVSRIKEIQGSDNVFILLEEKIDAKTKKKIESVAQKVEEHNSVAVKKESFNIFALTDVLGRRNRKELWVLYQRARMHGVAPEEVHGILFWQIKSMLLAAQETSAKSAGLKPFVYSKAKGFLSNYSQQELKSISKNLVDLYHDARRGIGTLDTSLERFILTL